MQNNIGIWPFLGPQKRESRRIGEEVEGFRSLMRDIYVLSFDMPALAKLKTSPRRSLVMGILFRIQNHQQKRKSRRTASTDGGNLLAKTSLVLEKGAIFEGLQNAKQYWYLALLGPSKTRITGRGKGT